MFKLVEKIENLQGTKKPERNKYKEKCKIITTDTIFHSTCTSVIFASAYIPVPISWLGHRVYDIDKSYFHNKTKFSTNI